MTSNYLVLIPPSEGKNGGGDNKCSLSFNELDNLRKEVISNLSFVCNNEDSFVLGKLFKVKGDALSKAIFLNKEIGFDNCLMSMNRFSGVMFKSLDYFSLSEKQKKNFDANFLIVDAVFGLIRPYDFVPDYKLMMGSKFNGLNTVLFWKKEVSLCINRLNKEFVLDLLPNIHREVITDVKNVVSINFVEELSDGSIKNVGHKSKALKGDFMKYISFFENITLDLLKAFVHEESYFFCEELSCDKKFFYKKKRKN